MLAQKRGIALCAVLSVVLTAFQVHAARVSLSWTKPTTNQDNTPLTDLAGYKVYHGFASRSYDVTIDVGLTTSAVLSDLQDGRTYYFAVTAYDTSGNQSLFTEVQHTTALADTDGDGLTDVDEINIYHTDPNKADTDGDGIDDGAEVAFWGANWNADADGDGIINLLDPDPANPPPPPDDGGNACASPNLAMCATVSASSVWSAGYEAAQATDGNGGTRWNSANGDTVGAWLALDFGALATFDTIVLKEAGTRITGYRLQYWDGSTWRDILSGNSIGATKTHTFAALIAQRVRLYVTSTVSGGSSGTPTIAEFEVYSSDTDNGGNPCGFANLAMCATASASSVWSAGYEAAQATDGNGGTRWNSANGDTVGAWLALDFGALATFDTIVLKEAGTRITGYRLQYWDGSTWRDILSGNSIGATKTHTFAALIAQRVRLYVTSTVSGGSSGTPTIYEFEVYE